MRKATTRPLAQRAPKIIGEYFHWPVFETLTSLQSEIGRQHMPTPRRCDVKTIRTVVNSTQFIFNLSNTLIACLDQHFTKILF